MDYSSFITNISLGIISHIPFIHSGHSLRPHREEACHEKGGSEDAQGYEGIVSLSTKSYDFSIQNMQFWIVFVQVLAYFSTHEWKWSNDNVMKLNSELTGSDKETFNFDLSTLDWKEFMDDYVKVLFLWFDFFLHALCITGNQAVCSQRGSSITG